MFNKNHKVIYSVMLLTLLTMFIPSRTIAAYSPNQNDSFDVNQTQTKPEIEPEIQDETSQDRTNNKGEYKGRRKNSLTTGWNEEEEFYSEFLKRKFSGLEIPTPLGDEIIPEGNAFKHISPINVIEEKLPTITFPANFSSGSSVGPKPNVPLYLTEMFTDFRSDYDIVPTTTAIDEKIEDEILCYIPFIDTNGIFITDTYDNNSPLPETETHQFQVKTRDGFDGIKDIEFWETDRTELDDYGNIVSADDVSHGGWDKAALDGFCSSDSCDSGAFIPQGTWGYEKLEKDSIYNITINYDSGNPAKDGEYVFEYGSSSKNQEWTEDYMWNSDEPFVAYIPPTLGPDGRPIGDQDLSPNPIPSDETSYIDPSIRNPVYNGTDQEWSFTADLQTYNFPYTETFIDDISFVDYPYWFNSTTTENAAKFNDSSDKAWDNNLNLMAPWIDVYLVEYSDNSAKPYNPSWDLPIEESRLIYSEMLTNNVINNPTITPLDNDPLYTVNVAITEDDLLGTGASFDGAGENLGGDNIILDVNWHAKHSHPQAGRTSFNFKNNIAWVTMPPNDDLFYIFNFSNNSNNMKIEYLGANRFRFMFNMTIYDIEAKGREIIYKLGNDNDSDIEMWQKTTSYENNHISDTAKLGEPEEFTIDIEIDKSVTFIQFGLSQVQTEIGESDPIAPWVIENWQVPKAYFRNSIMIEDITNDFVGKDWKITFHIWAPDDMAGKKLWWKDDLLTEGNYVDDQTYHGPGVIGEEGEEPHCIFEGGVQKMTITIKSSVWSQESIEVGDLMEFGLGASEIAAHEVDTKTIIATNIDKANNTIVVLPDKPPTEKDTIIIASIILGLTVLILFGTLMLLWRLKNSKTNQLILESLGQDVFNIEKMEEDFDKSL